MNLLIETGIKSVVLLAAALVLMAVMRRSSPALRHRVLALAFLALAGLPLLAVRLPELRVEASTPPVSYAPPKSEIVASNPAVSASPTVPSTVAQPEVRVVEVLPGLVAGIWGFGALFFLARLLRHLFLANALAKGGTELAVDPALSLPVHLRLVRTSKVDVPVTLGYVRPTILLPPSSASWPEAQVKAVLLHEGAHVRRGDWLWLVLSGIMSALYWPNLLVHLAAAKMRTEAELAADDAVIRGGIQAADYATTLVDLAEGIRSQAMIAALPFVDKASLKGRIVQILSATANRKPLGRGVAIAILCLGVALVLPFAAVRLVQGAAQALNGSVALGDGHQLEIIAITEMRGNVATSWDMHGAVMPRPLPIGQTNRNELKSSPGDGIERYVILRTDDAEGEIPTLFAKTGEPLTTVGYVEQVDGTGQVFRDAIGGRYFVTRIVAPTGTTKASFQTDLPTGDWKLVAYQNLKQGEVVGLLNPTVDLRVAPLIPARGRGIEATFAMPEKLAESETLVRFLPDNRDASHFQRFTGTATAYSSTPIERLERVEILARPMQKVEFGDIPLRPDRAASYTARNFLPPGVITSTGNAGSPDRATVAIKGFVGDGATWSTSGSPIPGPGYREISPLGTPSAVAPSRAVTVWLEVGSNANPEVTCIYDGEGWPLFRGRSTTYHPARTELGFAGIVDPSLKARDIAVPVATGARKTMVTFDRRAARTSWKFCEREGWSGCLRVDYPIEKISATQGMDLEICPVTSRGEQVKQKDAVRISESSPGWIEFDLPRDKATQVAAIEFRARPYTWVRFADVALKPRSR